MGWVFAGAPMTSLELRWGWGEWWWSAAAVVGEAWQPLMSEKEIKKYSKGMIDDPKKGVSFPPCNDKL